MEIINLKDKINGVVTDFKIKNNKTLDKEKAIHDFLALSVVDRVGSSGIVIISLV